METVIELKNVSKRFTLVHDRPRSFQEKLIRILSPGKKESAKEEFWALKEVSFKISKGKTVGLIGANGSGKSTALKLMAGILQPTGGEIIVDGRISALLELGSGMHPELTGRENIFLNGSLLGISNSEMRKLYPRIVHFSELKRFIDMPVKHYSSGMYMRLGFSIAIHVQPDILLLDEVLAVGDQSFQVKCLDRIYRMKNNGVTIVMVSHGIDTVQEMCDELIWLKQGVLMGQGNTSTIAGEYLRHIHESTINKADDAIEDEDENEGDSKKRWGSGEVKITDVRFRRGKEYKKAFLTGDPFTIEIHYMAHERIKDPMFGLAIHHINGTHINGPNNKFAGLDFGEIEGAGVVNYTIHDLPLMPGTYEVTVSAYDTNGIHDYDVLWRAFTFSVHAGATREQYGMFCIPATWEHQPSDKNNYHYQLNGRSARHHIS